MPQGGALDAAAWAGRHRGIRVLLWGHVLALPLIAVIRGESFLHGLAEATVVAVFALGGEFHELGARFRSASATLAKPRTLRCRSQLASRVSPMRRMRSGLA